MRLYERAIGSARDNGFVNNEALAHEIAARFYADRGLDRIAKTYLQGAREAYRQWGADGKVRQLEAHFPYLIVEHPSSDPTRTMMTPVEQLDLSTVLKLSQAVQGETDLEKLIAVIMRLALEHAGAERGLLIVPHGDAYRLEAEAKSSNESVLVDLRHTSIGADDLPHSVLQYVLRTRERVLLQDALAASEFAHDEYLRRHHARSVLCIPLLKQTRLVGIIYLENNLTPGAFTPARMALLEVLASDAAISLENARLYRDLQEREARVRRLIDANIIGVSLWHGDGRILDANEEFLRIVGYDREDLVSGDVHWTDLTPPEEREAVLQTLEKVTAGSNQKAEERELLRKDGSRVPVLAGGTTFEGVPDEGLGFVVDVTERKRAELALRESEREARLIVETIPGFVASLSPAGEVESVSNGLIEYCGQGLEAMKQWGTNGTVHVDDLPHVVELFTRKITSGEPYDFDARIRRRDGIYRWFQVRGLPLRDAGGQIVRWYSLLSDIEDRKRAEAELSALKDQLYKENLVLRDEVDRTSMFEEIVGTSPALQPVLARVTKVAGGDSTVLITGETGTGKELVARAIHRRSARASRAFVSINCAAIPRELVASELFGHEKGAFTGATQRRLGRFELAHGGTIFLDEIGELPMETQVALLRVLQEREFDRVGGTSPVRVDVRVVAATNRDLQAAVEAGTFRSDLFYRLNVFPVAVPALRERADDIPLLVEYFIDRYSRKAGKTLRRINKRTLDHLRAYPWPGNVRELQNIIERSVIVCDTEEFTVDESWLSGRPTIEGPLRLSGTVAAHEKTLIEDALRACGGRVYGPAGAAERLGIARSTLESKIRALRINKNRFRH
jgi:PAS domain S-box-containing protein